MFNVKIWIQETEAKRKLLKVSIAEMCREARVNFNSWHNWKKGKFNPQVASMERITLALERIEIRKQKNPS